MNELTADYLKDLLDLDDNEDGDEDDGIHQDLEEEQNEDMEEKEGVVAQPEITEKDRLQQARGGSNLLEDPKFNKYIKKIDQYWNEDEKVDTNKQNQGGIDDEEYHLITNCTEYISVIDREILNIHKYIRDIYITKFPELENLILNPLEYVKCVMIIKNEMDMNKVNLTGILTQHTIMAVTLAGSSTTGKPLSEKDLQRALDACELVIKLDEIKTKILSYVESRMQFIAPNLSEVIGSTGAAQLIAVAGGLESLAAMPACNIQVIGAQRKNLLGFSKAMQKTHLGLFGTMDIVKNAPKEFQTKLVRILSTNCAKAARVDSLRSDPSGSIGKDLKDKMLKRFDKIQEPPPPKLKKPLAAPDDKPKKRRGGKKYRNMKQKLAMTEFRKQANRLKFGAEGEEEYRDTGVGFGMIGDTGMGRVKIATKDNKLNLSKKQKNDLARNMNSQNASGLTSSIVLTSNRGIDLVNPDYVKTLAQKKGRDNYFNEESGFSTVLKTKQSSNTIGNIFGPK